MALIEIKKDPSKGDLRWFGLVAALGLGLVGLIARFSWDAQNVALGLWIAGGALAIVYYAVPPLRRPLFVGWMYLFFPLGWLISHVLLGAIFYLVVTPIGLVMRLVGYDPMSRRFEPDATSYWIERCSKKSAARYFSQF